MYNLLEYSQNYSMTSGSLWNYFRDEIDDVDVNASDGELFKYIKKNSATNTRKTRTTTTTTTKSRWNSITKTTTTSSTSFKC